MIVEINLILQRNASEEEIGRFEVLQEVFADMSPEERSVMGVRNVTDLARSDDPIAHMVRYGASRGKTYLVNEIFVTTGELQTGREDSKTALWGVVRKMLAARARSYHEFFYVTARFQSPSGKELGWRTVISRIAVPREVFKRRKK